MRRGPVSSGPEVRGLSLPSAVRVLSHDVGALHRPLSQTGIGLHQQGGHAKPAALGRHFTATEGPRSHKELNKLQYSRRHLPNSRHFADRPQRRGRGGH